MGKQYKELTEENIAFIKQQPLFYIASCSNQEVNLSPKGFDSIVVKDSKTLIYLDYPGSGNRTARDIKNDGEITLVFNAFSGPAQIVRLFCKGALHDKSTKEYAEYFTLFNDVNTDHIRQIISFHIYAVESSCGMSVPKMAFQKQRTGLKKWIAQQNDNGTLEAYIDAHEEPVNLNNLSE